MSVCETATLHETTNARCAREVLEALIATGVQSFCLCPGARNAPLLYPLLNSPSLSLYHWPEERSAAFFALGRIKNTGEPTAVITTSGTAAAELLPAAIEAYYTGLPLVLVTADRPRRFRGSGAPQAIEQVRLFGHYVHASYDIAAGERCLLAEWDRKGPLHLNVCLEEPREEESSDIPLERVSVPNGFNIDLLPEYSLTPYIDFIESTRFPLVIVGTLTRNAQKCVLPFLLALAAPVILEASSGLREDPRLAHLIINCTDHLWRRATQAGYPIDGVLRLGGVPTTRLWRDLEYRTDTMQVCSISEQPFRGVSEGTLICLPFPLFVQECQHMTGLRSYPYAQWKAADQQAIKMLEMYLADEPHSEQSLVKALSERIPQRSKVYLGNSLPIRHWDQVASRAFRGFQVACNRGANGIDGQLATFLGYSSPEQENWALLGDLTLLYDLVAPWITAQLDAHSINVVVMNNKGAGIFSRLFSHPLCQHTHQLSFESFARFWGWHYDCWEDIPNIIPLLSGGRLIELMPDGQATARLQARLFDTLSKI